MDGVLNIFKGNTPISRIYRGDTLICKNRSFYIDFYDLYVKNIWKFDELQYFVNVSAIPDMAFWKCYYLESVVLPDDLRSIGQHAFDDCSSLMSVNIPEGVTSIGDYAFQGCVSLDISVNIPDGVTTISEGLFKGCINIPSVSIPSGVTSIGGSAFRDCSSLTSVVIPEGVTSIGGSAFRDCSSLTSVVIPEGVTSIGGGAFAGCISLKSVTIPSTVTSIGYCAFCTTVNDAYNGSGAPAYLDTVTILATTPPSIGIGFGPFGVAAAFNYNSSNQTKPLIYVPAASVNTYKTDSTWSVWSNLIQAIPE